MNTYFRSWLVVVALTECSSRSGSRICSRAAAPSPPPTYEIEIRYQIQAFRKEHVVQFLDMVRTLEASGLTRALGPEDEVENPRVTHMKGTIDSARARQLLLESHVKTILLLPQGSKLPSDASPVRVLLELTSGFRREPPRFQYELSTVRSVEQEGGPRLERQCQMAEQVREVLKLSGFPGSGRLRSPGPHPASGKGACQSSPGLAGGPATPAGSLATGQRSSGRFDSPDGIAATAMGRPSWKVF